MGQSEGIGMDHLGFKQYLKKYKAKIAQLTAKLREKENYISQLEKELARYQELKELHALVIKCQPYTIEEMEQIRNSGVIVVDPHTDGNVVVYKQNLRNKETQ